MKLGGEGGPGWMDGWETVSLHKRETARPRADRDSLNPVHRQYLLFVMADPAGFRGRE